MPFPAVSEAEKYKQCFTRIEVVNRRSAEVVKPVKPVLKPRSGFKTGLTGFTTSADLRFTTSMRVKHCLYFSASLTAGNGIYLLAACGKCMATETSEAKAELS